ncbi:MAG: serine/threonine-protein kinase [Pseudomonadota bacterium]
MTEATETLDVQHSQAISKKLSEIGPYQLLEVVGEGGMGAVYRALQEQPIRREVAIKVTRLDLTSVRRLARFQAERQTLARLNHPHIATVFDAGETPDGFPYMVMEYLDGSSLLKYCNAHRLPIERRIELFIELCGAIGYAHQQGVVHRDLKPSNVMVTEVDGQPVPKVIDFGIAKIADAQVDHTMEGALLGTPAYMSPEQIRQPQDVDSRTDVYSLGLILYELLTDNLPFERRSRSNWSEVPDHPLKSPSSRIRTADQDEVEALVDARSTAVDTLVGQLRGDLDWVVLKAVQEDPSARYASTGELAADLERYLSHYPVSARPPSKTHAAWRFVQRHRLETAAALLLVAGLAGAVVVSTRAMLSAQAARGEAELEAQRSTAMNNFLVETLRSADPRVGGRDVRVVDVLAQAAEKASTTFADQPRLEATMLETLGYTYAGLGQPQDGEPLLKRALELRVAALGPTHEDTLTAENQLIETQAGYEPLETIGPRFEDLYGRVEQYLPATHPLMMTMLNNMAYVYLTRGMQQEDVKSLERGTDFARRSLEVRVEVLGREAPDTSHARNNLANGLLRLKRFAQAEALFRENLEIQPTIFGERNHYTLSTRANLANVLIELDELDEARGLLEAALAGMAEVNGEDHPAWLRAAVGLAEVRLMQQPNDPEAVDLIRKILALAGERPEASTEADNARNLLTKFDIAL